MKKLILIFLFTLVACNMGDYEVEQAMLQQVSNQSLSAESRGATADSLFTLLMRKRNDSVNRAILFEVGRSYHTLNQNEKFQFILNVLETRAAEAEDLSMLGKINHSKGILFSNNFMFDSAFVRFLSASKFYKAFGAPQLPKLYSDMGRLHQVVSDYAGAERYALKALDAAPVNSVIRYDAYVLLGNVYCEIKDYGEALGQYALALAFLNQHKASNKVQLRAVALNNIGNIYKETDRFQEAIPYFEDALSDSLVLKNTDVPLLAKIQDNYGFCLMSTGRDDEAAPFFDQAYSMQQEHQVKDAYITTLAHIGELMSKRRRFKSALATLREAEDLTRKWNFPQLRLECYRVMAIADKRNMRAHALAYIGLRDSLTLDEKRNRDRFARIEYETEELAREKLDASSHRQLISASAAALLVALVVLYLLWDYHAKRKQIIFVGARQDANEIIFAELNKEQERTAKLRQAEKTRIAHELGVGIVNRLRHVRKKMMIFETSPDPATLQKCVPMVRELHLVEQDIREVAHDLSQPLFSGDIQFQNVFRNMIEETKKLSPAKVHLDFDYELQWERINSETKINLYQVIQELVRNAHHHAKPRNIYIAISVDDKTLEATVHDDGIGFNSKKMKIGKGYRIVVDRLNIIKGRYQIFSTLGVGTTVLVQTEAKMPLI